MNEPFSMYARFIRDKALWGNRGFILSEDLEKVKSWDGIADNEGKKEVKEEDTSEDNFQSLSRYFEKTMANYQVGVPHIMRFFPILIDVEIDRRIRKYLQNNAEIIETGEFETYKFGLSHLLKITKEIEVINGLDMGIKTLPSLFLLGLVSAYDAFLAKLIRIIFLTRPEILSSSEKNISFKDLVEIGSISSVRERIIEKEIETIMRSNHSEQIEWLESKLTIPLRKDLDIWPKFIEICERRNLLTHTDGVVSSQYVKVCKENRLDVQNVCIGDKLDVDHKYFKDSVLIIMELGLKLIQVVWRKLLPADVEDAALEWNRIGYRLIQKKQYDFASKMLHFGIHTMKKHGCEASRKRMVVNLANAEKLAGRKEKSLEIIKLEDWSASSEDFLICVAAVRDEVDVVTKMMSRVVQSGRMSPMEFREWPVFEPLRSNADFVEEFEKAFGEPLFLERSKSIEAGTLEPVSKNIDADAEVKDGPEEDSPSKPSSSSLAD